MNPPNFAVQAKLQSGFALHQQGRIREAEGLYQEVLRLDKRNVDALHLIGVICYQTGRFEEAVDFISKAIKLHSGAAMAYYNRGNALNALGRPGEAVADYNKALSLNPQYVEAYNNRGTALNNLQRFAEALASYDKAIAFKPDFAEAYNNRGVSLKELGRHDESVASLDKAISLQPRYAEAFNNRGLALQELGRFTDALASYNRAIEIQPGYAEVYNNRGNAFAALQRLDDALANYDRAIELKPGYTEAYSNRGNVLQSLGRRDEALANYNKAIGLNPNYAEAYNNRGNVLRRPGQLDEALASFDRAIELRPAFAEAYANRGKALVGLKRFGEAEASFDKALALKPGFPGAHFNKAQFQLLFGDFTRGWNNYAWRKSIEAPSGNRDYPRPLLTSLDDAGSRTVLVHWEQGLGDTIQFCRYINLLASRCAKVLFAPQAALKPLMVSLHSGVELVDAGDPPSFDFHVPLLDLPRLFETTIETVPANIPYLSADPVLAASWREKLPQDGIRVGICWQGSLDNKEDIFRSFAVELFEPLAHIPGVRLISLQTGHGAEQLETLPDAMKVETLPEDFVPFASTAAAMASLDLIITADTAIAHLAGALGLPVWVALSYVPEWRWLLDRPDSPWYPGMRLFRQKADGDWKAVFEDIETALLEKMSNFRI